MEMKEENLPFDFAFNFFSPQAHQKFHILVFFSKIIENRFLMLFWKIHNPEVHYVNVTINKVCQGFLSSMTFLTLLLEGLTVFWLEVFILFSYTLQTAEAMAFSRDDSNVPEGSALSPRQQMLSSGAGALLVSLFMTPLDVVKIRLQVWIFNKIFQVIENLN